MSRKFAQMQTIAVGTGILMQCFTVALYLILLFFNPYASIRDTSESEGPMQVAAIQIGLALVGGGVTLWRRPFLMLLIGVLQFAPVGCYMLGTPGIFRWIGLANLGFVGSAVLLLLLSRERDRLHS